MRLLLLLVSPVAQGQVATPTELWQGDAIVRGAGSVLDGRQILIMIVQHLCLLRLQLEQMSRLLIFRRVNLQVRQHPLLPIQRGRLHIFLQN